MTKYLLATIFTLITALSFGQTQSQMNQDASRDYKKADNELNRVYQQIIKDYRTDTAFIKNLKTAQRLWVQFRDAEVKVKYPDMATGYYGSMQPLCWYSYLTELTEERTKKLMVWLTGIPEGDSCAGSVKKS